MASLLRTYGFIAALSAALSAAQQLPPPVFSYGNTLQLDGTQGCLLQSEGGNLPISPEPKLSIYAQMKLPAGSHTVDRDVLSWGNCSPTKCAALTISGDRYVTATLGTTTITGSIDSGTLYSDTWFTVRVWLDTTSSVNKTSLSINNKVVAGSPDPTTLPDINSNFCVGTGGVSGNAFVGEIRQIQIFKAKAFQDGQVRPAATFTVKSTTTGSSTTTLTATSTTISTSTTTLTATSTSISTSTTTLTATSTTTGTSTKTLTSTATPTSTTLTATTTETHTSTLTTGTTTATTFTTTSATITTFTTTTATTFTTTSATITTFTTTTATTTTADSLTTQATASTAITATAATTAAIPTVATSVVSTTLMGSTNETGAAENISSTVTATSTTIATNRTLPSALAAPGSLGTDQTDATLVALIVALASGICVAASGVFFFRRWRRSKLQMLEVGPLTGNDEVLDSTNCLELPEGKEYHYYLSYEKTHKRLGGQPEELATSLDNMLLARGLVGVCKSEPTAISELEHDIGKSCILIACLHDETSGSARCRLEWEKAKACNLPVLCVADVESCDEKDIFSSISISDVPNYLPQTSDWVNHRSRHRREVIDAIMKMVEQNVQDRTGRAPVVVTAPVVVVAAPVLLSQRRPSKELAKKFSSVQPCD